MTVAENMKIMQFRYLGMREADAEACMQHVRRELGQDSLFVEYTMRFGSDYWEQPIQNFQPNDLRFAFEKFVSPVAFRWLIYRYYDLLDER